MKPKQHEAKPISEQTVAELLGAVAAKSPAPGGGAVVAAVGALAAVLGGMVVAYSSGKKSAGEHNEAAATLERITHSLLDLADEDARAYAGLNRLQKLAEGDPRREGLARAAKMATGVPLRVLAECLQALDMLETLVGTSNRWLRSDLAIAAVLLEAAARAALWNVRINVPTMREAGVGAHDIQQMMLSGEIAETVPPRVAAIEQACREGW